MSETPDQPPPKRRRRRPALSCEHCRRRKTKCDRNEPCGPCIQAKYTDCSYVSRAFRTDSPAARSNAVLPPGGQSNGTGTPHLGNGASEVAPQFFAHTPPYRTPQSSYASGSGHVPVQSQGYKALGTFSKTRLFGQSHWMHSFGRFDSFVSLDGSASLNASTFSDERSKIEIKTLIKRCKEISKSTKVEVHREWLQAPDFETLVPTRELSDTLINLYFSTGESLHRILHYPTFKREYLQYWEQPSSANSAFIIKMLVAMANGAAFYQEPDAKYIEAQSKKWIFAGQHWLSQLPSEKSRLNITGLQIHCLVILGRQAQGIVADLAWISAGSLLRAAINMGMQRDPKVFPKMTPLHAELRRRLWATILELNLQLALDMGMNPMITTDDYDTEPPSNIDDSDVDEDTRVPVQPKSSHIFTQTAVQRILMDSFPLRLRACRLVNDFRVDPSYEIVLEVGAHLLKACKDATIFNVNVNNHGSIGHMTQMQRNLLDLSIRRFLFLLHGTFSMRALTDPRYHFSRKVCLDSATIMTSYPTNELGTITQPINSPRYDQFTLLKVRSQDYFKRVEVHSCMTILHELFQQIDDDKDSPLAIREQGRRLREPLKQTIRDAIDLCEKRIVFAANNVKGHIFLSAVYGQLEALEEGRSADQGAVEGAIRSARTCLDTLTLKPINANVVNKTHEEIRNITDILTPPDQSSSSFDGFGLEDWNAGFGGADSWLFTGWEDERTW